MTQLSNVPMQPKPDAAERPMTLIEKLERELAGNCRLNNWDLGFKAAIEVVKQHSDWVGVDERLPPDNMMVLAYCHIRKATGYAFVSNQQAWSFYHFTKNSENQAWAMANDISKWMPIPQPPSEVQDETA